MEIWEGIQKTTLNNKLSQFPAHLQYSYQFASAYCIAHGLKVS